MTAVSSTIGVIGLGSMGLGMARSLLRAGLPVWGYDIREEVRNAFVAEGGRPLASLGEGAETAEVLFIVVVNAAQTESVLFGSEGIASRLRSGTVVVACANCPCPPRSCVKSPKYISIPTPAASTASPILMANA